MSRSVATPETVTVHVPFRLVKRGGRKEMIVPVDAPAQRPRVDNTVVKALARAFRWRKLLETGVYSTLEDIARAEKINTSYVSRILRLSLLAPDLVEAILDGRQGPEVTMAVLQRRFPVEWEGQRAIFTAR